MHTIINEAERLVERLRAMPGLHSSHYAALADALAANKQELQDHELTVETARSNYCSDDINIDDSPLLSVADEGVWVSAWVWVPIEKGD